MKGGIAIFLTGVVVLVGVVMAVGAPLMANPKTQTVGGLVLGISILIPFTMAFLAQRASGSPGSPFKGLVWGPTPYYFLCWLGGIAVGLVAAALTLGLGLGRFDPEMTDYIEMAKGQAEEKGTEVPKEAESGIKIVGMVTAVAGPTIGPWFLAAFICLGTFPWLGFLYRRLMVYGKVKAMLMLALVWLVIGAAGGLIKNPMAEELSMPVRMLLNGAMTAAVAPVVVWLFLRTGSAVIPALAQASYQGLLSACTAVFSDVNMLLGVPMGVVAILSVLMTGIALWIWKDPGGEQLEVAAVASDGTPLTRRQVEALSTGGVPAVALPTEASAPL